MIHLTRFALLEDRTMGRLQCGDKYFWSVEKPWKNNEPFVSCIPAGSYKMARRDSPKFGPGTWEILDVPGRSHILIHVGNTANDVVGCISLGTSLFTSCEGVQNSRKAIKEFDALTQNYEELEIVITEGYLQEGNESELTAGGLPKTKRAKKVSEELEDTQS